MPGKNGKGTATVRKGTRMKTHSDFDKVLRYPVTPDMKSPAANIFREVEAEKKVAVKKSSTEGAK